MTASDEAMAAADAADRMSSWRQKWMLLFGSGTVGTGGDWPATTGTGGTGGTGVEEVEEVSLGSTAVLMRGGRIGFPPFPLSPLLMISFFTAFAPSFVFTAGKGRTPLPTVPAPGPAPFIVSNADFKIWRGGPDSGADQKRSLRKNLEQ